MDLLLSLFISEAAAQTAAPEAAAPSLINALVLPVMLIVVY